MRVLALSLLSAASATAAEKTSEQSIALPAQFVANRVFVVPITEKGEQIRFFTDSGGGLFITDQAVQRLHLPTETAASDSADAKDAPPALRATLPKFKTGFGIPLPPDTDGKIPVMPLAQAPATARDYDAMLGQSWFGGHVWTWNYPAGTLRIEGARWKPNPKSTRVPLGFPTDENGRANNFARIAIRVDGKSIDMLLDTGATTLLTDAALHALDDGLPAHRATSFIVSSIFKGWHDAHPDWRVIEKGEDHTKADMIEVPEVEIAGARVGPVWFTRRADSNFHEFMSSMMDGQVEGAIGGDAFSHFVMTIDYPNAVAYFHCAKDCRTR